MGVLKKLKDIFYDEEIIEEEVPEEKPSIKEIEPEVEKPDFNKKDEIKEEKPEEIEIPRFDTGKEEKEEKPLEEEKTIPERELFQSKKTFNFPILEEEEEKPKTRSNVNVMELKKQEKQERKVEENLTTNSNFKPSPVISPIYGILDKDFKKEDIMNNKRKIEETPRKSSSSFAYDTVRKKAYGSLDGEIEDTLNASATTKLEAEKILKEVDGIEKELNKLDETMPREFDTNVLDEIKERNKVTLGEIEEQTKKIEINDDIEDITREVKIEETSRIEKYKDDEETPKKKIGDVGDKTLEHDLFNLIDSMYEEEEE